jgi:hypothetical protein
MYAFFAELLLLLSSIYILVVFRPMVKVLTLFPCYPLLVLEPHDPFGNALVYSVDLMTR